MGRLGSGDGGMSGGDANTADEESRHRRKDYPHIHTPAKPHLLKQGGVDSVNQRLMEFTLYLVLCSMAKTVKRVINRP